MRLIKMSPSARVPPRTSPSALLSLLLSLVLFAFLWVDVVSGAVVPEKQPSTQVAVRTPTPKPTKPATSMSGDSMLQSATPVQISIETPKATTSFSTRDSVPTLITDTPTQDTDPNVSPVYSGFGLPIMPSITPGIAVTGVLLMLAGLPYCLVGIKQKKVQIFFSVAYLSSLGVTVLIVYVMNPPVKDAVQGAYVVAAVITGLFFGAIAVIFPEVTEKLGCLLGGFCLSMWFLVLKPGGLIDNTYGKLILIAVFSLTVFILAFHRITKPYALISACAFSGATSIVLGIDCFSRAGLKEFWLYIWDLNDTMFPLNTNTYPHTRGMRVEIAIILLITALGIMSQMKLWRILKERRDQKRAQKQKEQEDVERLDEDVGRRVQEEDSKARAEWEKIYGNAEASGGGSPRDSGVATSSTESKPISMDEDRSKKELDTLLEQEEMTKGNDMHVGGKVAEEDTEQYGENYTVPEPPSSELQSLPGEPASLREVGEGPIEQFEEHEAPLPVGPSPPPVLFQHHVPYLPKEEEYDEDVMSLATYADTTTHDVHPKELVKIDYEALEDVSQHVPISGDYAGVEKSSEPNGSAPNKVTLVAESFSGEGGGETIVVGSGEEQQANIHAREQPDVSKELQSTDTSNELQLANNSNESQETEPCEQGSTSIEDPKVGSIISGERRISSINSGDKSNSPPVSLSDLDALQNHCSRIHKTYRTNEWAKHLADAEVVELDDLSPYIEEGSPEEQPVPVLITQLQETAIPERRKSRREFQEPPPSVRAPLSFAVAATTTTQHVSSYSQLHPQHTAPLPPTVSVVPPPPATGVPSPLVSKSVLRQSSVSAIPEGEPAAKADKLITQQSVTPPPISRAMSPTPQIPYENTLIGRRESILKMRPSLLIQDQMIRSASPSGYQSPPAIGDPVPTYNMNTGRLANTDDIPLSQRRELLLNNQAGVQPQSRSQTPMPQISPRSSFGLAPPSPTTSASKQGQRLHSWRESLKQDVQISQAHWSERKAQHALNEKQQVAIYKREKEAEKAQRDALVEERMRMPDMLNAHREALRKLQAAATTT